MAKWQGKNLTLEIYGESHAEKIGVKASGFPEIEVDFDKLDAFLARRKAGGGVFSTSRIEGDKPVFDNLIDGKVKDCFTADIYNQNKRSSDYANLLGKPRPSHADYVTFVKDGVTDFSGGGRFSGRLTAPLCVAGGIALQYLETRGIKVHAYLSQVGDIYARSYKDGPILEEELLKDRQEIIPALTKKEKMTQAILNAKREGDSLGGKVECIVYGVPCGIGDNLFEGLEGKISALVYAIPAVKGVEFGDGFALCSMKGSQANDPLQFVDGKVVTQTNRAGGINGGISNGMEITLSVAFRPTPSISKPQKSVDLINRENVEIVINGRHDSCVAVRAVPCVESAVALAILDEII